MNWSRLLGGTLLFVLLVGCTSSNPPGNDDDDNNNDNGGPPTLTSVVPVGGIVTTTITVEGTNFGATAGTVTIGGGEASIVSWSGTDIVAAVGPNSFPGNHQITVTRNDTQTVTGLDFRVTLPPMVYVHNDQQVTNTVGAYDLDPATGALTELADSPYDLGAAGSRFGGDGHLLEVHEGTRRLFATNNTSVAVFDIDPVTGELSSVNGSPFSTGGTRAFGIEVSSTGDRAYVANFNSDDITVFDVAADGSLTSLDVVAASVVGPDIPVLADDDSKLYVNGEAGDQFMIYEVQATTVIESTDSPMSFGNLQGSIAAGFGGAIHPSGLRFYLADFDFDYIWEYDVDPVTKVPDLGTSDCVNAVGGACPITAPNSMVFNSDGSVMFASQFYTNNLYTLDASSIGILSNQTAHALPGVTGMSAIAPTPDDAHIVIVDELGADIHVFELNSGVPGTEVNGSPFAGGAYDGAGGGMSGLYITSYSL